MSVNLGDRLSDFFIIVRRLIYREMERVHFEGSWSDLLGEIISKDQRTARRYCEQDMSQIPHGVTKRIQQRLALVDTKNELTNYINNYHTIKES